MPLTCWCDTFGDYDWYYNTPDDYDTLRTKRRVRCSSCRDLIDIGAVIALFSCYRPPCSEIEDRIWGDDGEVPIADKRLCEKCADLFFSFDDLGFRCVAPDEHMSSLAKEYAEIYGPNPKAA